MPGPRRAIPPWWWLWTSLAAVEVVLSAVNALGRSTSGAGIAVHAVLAVGFAVLALVSRRRHLRTSPGAPR